MRIHKGELSTTDTIQRYENQVAQKVGRYATPKKIIWLKPRGLMIRLSALLRGSLSAQKKEIPMKRNCVLHPDREANLDAQGIRVCDECWNQYNDERRETGSGSIRQRPFLQRLVGARHSLPERKVA